MTNIKEKLDSELDNNKKIPILSEEQCIEIINILKNIDSDLKPIHELFSFIIKNYIDDPISGYSRGLVIVKLLEFYGIGNSDILTIRQKFIIEDNKLVKKPFLKNNQKECINILLKEQGLDNE